MRLYDAFVLEATKQRRHDLHSTFRDVAAIVCDLTINPDSGRPYTVLYACFHSYCWVCVNEFIVCAQIAMIQNAMKQIHFSANLTKSAKQQVIATHYFYNSFSNEYIQGA